MDDSRIVSGNPISSGTASYLVLTIGLIVLFFDILAKRVPNLQNHLEGIALIVGGVYTGLGL